jgi:hypothetical protein
MYSSSFSRSSLSVPTSKVTASVLDGLYVSMSVPLPVVIFCKTAQRDCTTHSTPAASVYITALADEMPIPPEP